MTSSAEPSTDGLRGLLTDVLRFSLHDGPGIRTTVFFKGCPLRCVWCHNPETQSPRPELDYHAERCVRCGECLRACGAEADGSGFVRERCADLDAAAAACTHDGLSLTGREWSVAEVMDEVRKDAAYYVASGGGITLSGGEPLLQADFATALLSAARAEKLHTCVESCGHVASERLESILPLVDLLLFDWKMTDSAQHRELTGVGNELIRASLAMAASQVPVVLRCPLIPGINDNGAHLAGIVDLASQILVQRIEIMPYHAAGSAKYARYGRGYSLPEIAVSDESRTRWM